MTTVQNTLDPLEHYGGQSQPATFIAGGANTSVRLLESGRPSEFLWDIAAAGRNVRFALIWGTYQTRRIEGLGSPLRVQIAGRFELWSRQLDLGQPGEASASLTVATAVRPPLARTLLGAAGPLAPTVYRVTALAAGTIVTVGGNAVPLPIGTMLRVSEPSALTAGVVLEEHDI